MITSATGECKVLGVHHELHGRSQCHVDMQARQWPTVDQEAGHEVSQIVLVHLVHVEARRGTHAEIGQIGEHGPQRVVQHS